MPESRPTADAGPLRRGQLETQSGSLLERIRRGRAAALPEFFVALRAPRFAESLTTFGDPFGAERRFAARGVETLWRFLLDAAVSAERAKPVPRRFRKLAIGPITSETSPRGTNGN